MLATRAVVVFLLGAFVLPALAQFGGSAPKYFPNRSDIKYIKCQVCELLAKNAYKQAKEMVKQSTPSARLTEEALIERMEKIANPLKDEGEWVAKLDLVEQGDKLVVKEMGQVGECTEECKTVERAAQDILDEHDTDIAEALYVGKKNRAQFSNWLCYELTNSCKNTPPPLPKDRVPGTPFKPADPEKLKMDRMMAGMAEQGLRGNMYSRDEAMAKYMTEQLGEDADEDEVAKLAEDLKAVRDMDASTSEQTAAGLGSATMQKLAQAKDAAGAGLLKAKEEAQKLWSKFAEKQEAGEGDFPLKDSAAEL